MTLLQDRVVIVAGVGPGLGRAVALGAARAGASVVLAARTAARLDSVHDEIVAAGGRALCVPTDVTDIEQCRALAGAAQHSFDRIDALVHTAFARPATGPVGDRTAADWHDALDGNVVSAVHLVQAVAPAMRAQRAGSVVLVSSISARLPYRQSAIYATMKAAQLTLTKVLAQDLGVDGVRVNCIVPGYIEGAGLARHFELVGAERGVSATVARADASAGACLGRFPSADEVAAAALFFASDLASGISGQSLDVNGGQWFG